MKAHAIYGPPGCGKTTKMMSLITLFLEQGWNPNQIAFVSHTKAAAAEALSRLNMTRSDKVSTIHSLAYRMLQLSSATIVDHRRLQEFSNLIGVPIKNGSVDSEEGIEVGDEYLGIMGKARNRLVPLAEEYNDSSHPGSMPQFEAFCKGYSEWKKANGFVDFTDMLERFVAHAAASRLPEFDAKILLVDEAQDLSALQWAVIDILCRKIEHVYIAGDDDQAIYVWGGADPSGMTDFQKRYGADHTVLGQSYRVPQLVQSVALGIIHQVQSRVDKVYAPRAELGVVNRFGFVDTIDFKHGEDTLVLCRTGAQKKEIEKYFIEQRIPYLMDGGRPGLYQTKLAKGIRAFMKLKNGEGLTQTEFDAMEAATRREYKDAMRERKFPDLMKKGHMQVFDVPHWNYDFYKEFDPTISPTIKVSSIHASKGREADRVIVHTGMTERTLEGMNKDPDAEHRVFYVATTRAKHRLDILDGDNSYEIREHG